MQTACNTIGIKLFNQIVTDTKISFEGLDLTGFTHLLRTDRDFLIDTAFKNGADLVKIQTYEPRDITLNIRNKFFKINL